ncbi:MAG: amino acid ABC transporter substrate-binding protein [Christensenellales bacterium]|jgi:polar amino acid transport system substrate-binding protein
MKKTLSLVLALMLLALAVTGCARNKAQEERTSLTVGFDADFPPYGFKGDDGQYTGFDLEMAQELCNRRGWELKLQPIDWDSKDMELESGTIDCVWNGFTINGREEKYTWTIPYMNNKQIFIAAKDSGIASFDDLAGRIVTAQADSAALHALEDEDNAELLNSFKELVVSSQYNAAFMDLEAGAVDAIAMDIGVAEYQIAGKEDQYVILDEPLLNEQYGIGFKLGNTELRDLVQETLIEMAEDGTFKAISEKWFDGRDVGIIGK